MPETSDKYCLLDDTYVKCGQTHQAIATPFAFQMDFVSLMMPSMTILHTIPIDFIDVLEEKSYSSPN